MSKPGREVFGEALAKLRKAVGLSVLDLSRKSGTSRNTIYELEAGRLNVTLDQYEKLLGACGVSVEEWIAGFDQDQLQALIPRDHQDLFHMLRIIATSGNQDLLHGIRVNLDAISEKALRLAKKHPPPQPSQVGESHRERGHGRKTRRAG